MGTVDYFEKEWIIENAMLQECKAQRKILFEEIKFLKSCLQKYESIADWNMFAYTLHKHDDYLEIAYKLGLLRVDEYLSMKGVCNE